jgi:hypothetical protein
MEMPKPIRNLTDMEIDEISLVDKGANQHAMITIAKRATEEEPMPEFDLFDEQGQAIDESALSDGDIVFDGEGNAYQFSLDDAVEEREPETVGKSAFFEDKKTTVSKGFAASVMEELSKAFSDDERDAVIAKALGRVEELQAQQEKFAEIAKAERDLRLTREYISKAAEYNLPVAPEELGRCSTGWRRPCPTRTARSSPSALRPLARCSSRRRATRAAATTLTSTRRSRLWPPRPSASRPTTTSPRQTPSLACST